jgi:hypothetical protein
VRSHHHVVASFFVFKTRHHFLKKSQGLVEIILGLFKKRSDLFSTRRRKVFVNQNAFKIEALFSGKISKEECFINLFHTNKGKVL